MFVCQSCGLTTPSPTADCAALVQVDFEGNKYMMPCSSWPLTPKEYIGNRIGELGEEAFFSGTVVMPDGAPVAVSAPIPESLARQIAVLSVEYDLAYQQRMDRRVPALPGIANAFQPAIGVLGHAAGPMVGPGVVVEMDYLAPSPLETRMNRAKAYERMMREQKK